MNKLTEFLISELSPDQRTKRPKKVGLYAGGFKPPTNGHYKVVTQALADNPDLDELKIYIGDKTRDGIDQSQSLMIWDIYKQYLPIKVTLEPTSKPPIRAVYDFAKENPEVEVDWVLGAREGNEEDFTDIAKRTKAADNYPNITLRPTVTDSGASGTAARNAAKVSQEKLEKLLPIKLSQADKDEVYNILNRDNVNEGDTYEKMAAKGKKAGNLKQGTVRKRLNIPKGEKIPLTKIKKEISRIKKMKNPSEKNKKYLKALNLAKTLKTTTNVNENTKNCGCGQDPCITYGNLNEGKYDGLVTKLAGFTLNAWKGDFEDDQRSGKFNLEIGPGREFDYPHLKFDYQANAQFIDKYKTSGYAVADPIKGLPRVSIGFKIDRFELPRMWEQIAFDLRNIIRHEIEHLMQDGPNVKKGKEMDSDLGRRRELTTGEKPWWKIWRSKLKNAEYYKLEKEVDANLQGLYLKAKKIRKPLAQVIDNYLKFNLNIPQEDQEGIKALWRERAPKINVPVFESKPFKREGTTFKIGQVLTYRGYKEQRDFPVEVVDVKWNEERNEYEYSLMLLRDLSRQKKRGLKMKFQSEEDIKRRLADKQLTRAEFERQATKRKDSFDKPITYKSVGHFEESKDPKKGTGKKPKGSGRRLYTDEDPKDTVGIKFSTRQDIVDTLNKKSFKAKSHARQSQIINLIHQRVRAALGRTKDPAKKKKLKSGFEYIKKRKEASKKKTQRLKKQKLNEVLNPKTFNFKPLIKSIMNSMENDGLNLKPYPKVIFKHNEEANADDFFGMTAYYAPESNEIVLYTLGRHPKDIMRSFAHELVHVHQNHEDRLHDIKTDDVNADEHLERLEREAYETGNIMFRSWTNSLTKESKDPFGLKAYAYELAKLNEDEDNPWYIYLDMDGVVANFDKRFEDLSGMLPQPYVDKFGLNAFWDLIDEKHKVAFWRGIEVMPGADRLVNFVAQYPYEMLTAPSVKKQSVIGKSLWVKDKVGTLYPSQPKVTYRPAKLKHTVKPNLTKYDILIDDKKSTIDRWNNAGGTAIFYVNANQVIDELKNLGL